MSPSSSPFLPVPCLARGLASGSALPPGSTPRGDDPCPPSCPPAPPPPLSPAPPRAPRPRPRSPAPARGPPSACSGAGRALGALSAVPAARRHRADIRAEIPAEPRAPPAGLSSQTVRRAAGAGGDAMRAR